MHTPPNDYNIHRRSQDGGFTLPPFRPGPRFVRAFLAAVCLLFAVSSALARDGSDDAQAHLDSSPLSDGTHHYTITLTNASSDNMGTFWFSWTPGKNFLPTLPTNIQSPTGWTAQTTHDSTTDGYGIQWKSASAPLTPGHSLTFTFDSADAPSTLEGKSTLYPTFAVTTSFTYKGAPFSDAGTQFALTSGPSTFFENETELESENHEHYLALPNGNPFGYYAYLSDDHYIYHADLGYEYIFDAANGKKGMFLYDFVSDTFFYTDPSFSFPYLYDFKLDSVVYYYPDPDHAGRYNTNGVRYFYVFKTGEIIHK